MLTKFSVWRYKDPQIYSYTKRYFDRGDLNRKFNKPGKEHTKFSKKISLTRLDKMGQTMGRMPETWQGLLEEKNRVLH